MSYLELYPYRGAALACAVWCIVEPVSGVGCHAVTCPRALVFKLCPSGAIVAVSGFGFTPVANASDRDREAGDDRPPMGSGVLGSRTPCSCSQPVHSHLGTEGRPPARLA